MSTKLEFRAVLPTLLVAGLVSYMLCIGGDLLFGWKMYEVWAPLFPGFTWPLTPSGFLLGLIWLFLYSIYGAVLIVWPYNLFVGANPLRRAGFSFFQGGSLAISPLFKPIWFSR